MRNDAVDQPDTKRLFRRDHVAGQQHFHRRLAADGTAQRHHRRRAEQADIDARRRETGLIRCDGEVAGRHQLAAGGGGDAVHLGDHRLGQAGDRQHQPRALAEQPFVGIAARIGAHLFQIVAGAEGRAVAGDDHHLDAAVVGQLLKLFVQARHQRRREGVAAGRPVQRQGRDAVGILAQQHGTVAGRRGRHRLRPVPGCAHAWKLRRAHDDPPIPLPRRVYS